jgi:hypothetical protein
MENTTQQNITINKSFVYNKIFLMLSTSLYVIFLTFTIFKIPEHLIDTSLSISLMIITLFTYFDLIVFSVDIRNSIKFFGQTMSLITFNNMNIFKKNPFYKISVCTTVFNTIIKFSYILTFIPISNNNCNIFSDYPMVCHAYQLISVIFLIGLSFIAVSIIWLIILLCRTYYEIVNRRQNEQRVRQLKLQILQQIIPNLPISDIPPLDDVCPICQEKKVDDKWLVLPCKHKFHSECITPWFVQSTTCPVCRISIIDVPVKEGVEQV